ncbi:MAG TPA: DUF4810 domain-containing protein [Burkholderiales bacterium]|nr:DUF4810 domain-containing protein [Burkholderiales bacterium]
MVRCHWAKEIVAIAALLFFAGCTTQPSLYNYEDYSSSYYNSVKTPGDETKLKLQQSMEKAIETAGESRSGRVPPGMYANLGYLYLKQGESAKAIEMFNREKTVYPEATQFMDRVIQKAELVESDSK